MSNKKDVLLGFFKSIDDHNYDLAERIMGKKHKMYSPMSPEPMDNAQHLGLMKAFNGGFTQGHHEFADVIEAGNKVVARGTWTGKHTGEFNGIPASGKQVKLPFIVIGEIEDNELRTQWIEMDSMTLLTQMGAIPAHA